MALRNRIFWIGTWSHGYNNPRREELLRRLTNVDRYYLYLHPWRIFRGFQRRLLVPFLTFLFAIRYPLFFCTDRRQIRFFPRRVVYDYDDPLYTSEETADLSRKNVAAIVVPTDWIRSSIQSAGIRKSIEVIPQGVSLSGWNAARVASIRREWRKNPEEIVIGLHQPEFLFREEMPADPQSEMNIVDLLLEVMLKVHARIPETVLWLVGRGSKGVEKFAAAHPWVRLLGYQPRAEIVNYVSAFDIGVYPRQINFGGRSSVKLMEFMACGIPIVGTSIFEMEFAERAGAALRTRNTEEFISALVRLCRDENLRKDLGQKGKSYAKAFNWDQLAEQYSRLLESYLP